VNRLRCFCIVRLHLFGLFLEGKEIQEPVPLYF